MSKIDNMTEKQPPSYPLRMPQELRERLAEVAKKSGRSMNAEIVARLEESLDDTIQRGMAFSGVLNRLLDAENLQITDNGVRLTLKIDVEPTKESGDQ
jgi:predicted DNA-binding protein